MRKISFAKGEYYHIYNRGVDKRSIFEDPEDLLRFLQSMKEFNCVEPVGGIFVNSLKKNKFRNPVSKTFKLVKFIAYCLNQNHYHFILEPLVDKGVQKFMHKLALGYTKFFNEKYKRSGTLFQGNYKATHIETNEYLLHLSVYVNLNDQVHSNLNEEWLLFLPFSSFSEYKKEIFHNFCTTDIVLSQYKDRADYCRYAKSVLPQIIQRKKDIKIIEKLLID